MSREHLADIDNISTSVVFEAFDETGLRIIDTLGRSQLDLWFDRPPTTDPISTDHFYFPVDHAVSVAASEIVLEDPTSVFIRTGSGEFAASLNNGEQVSLDRGSYIVEIDASHKVYLEFDAAFAGTCAPDTKRLTFPEPTPVGIGARSTHPRPQHTIRTPRDPFDLFRAISTFHSALKTDSPERSFATLRGYPPQIDEADQLTIPPDLAVPDRGIHLQVPPSVENAFIVAPLAYYLGADVRAGDTPRLQTDAGWTYRLDDPLHSSVARVLRQSLLFDAVTRTVGFYPFDLGEAAELSERLGYEPSTWYDAGAAERLPAYLEHPYEAIEDLVPTWPAHARVSIPDVTPELITHLANDLATIQPVEASWHPADDDSGCADAAEHLWFGEGIRGGHTKGHPLAYQHRLDIEQRDELRVAVVLNDTDFDRELDVIEREYADQRSIPFNVTIHRDLSSSELEALVAEPIELLHFVGHTDSAGLRCHDGHLDVGTLSNNQVTYFVLNSCTSFEQGIHLIETGSVAGVATVADINDRSAAWFGLTLGRLLNTGYPLHAAIDILDGETLLSDRYVVLGTGTASVSKPDSIPFMVSIESSDSSGHTVENTHYHNEVLGVGSMVSPNVSDVEDYILIPNSATWTVSTESVHKLLEEERVPVRIDGELYWSDEIDDLPPA